MIQTTQSTRLPTLDKLGASLSADVDVDKVAADWLQAFASEAKVGNVDGVLKLFLEDGYWRDYLVLTWDFRTFDGSNAIRQFLADRLAGAKLDAFTLTDFVRLEQPYPDLAWIVAIFNFESDVSVASGVVHLVPTADGSWKAHQLFTTMEDLKDFREKTGSLRSVEHVPGTKWAEKRRREAAFEDSDPAVLIIGGGHSGLELAARLKYHNVPVLVVEKTARLGDNWRSRYDTLCLHWPIWYDHMPYVPFPPTWPLYTPSLKMADWIESYAHHLELNVWTATTALQATRGPDNKWSVLVRRGDGTERVLRVNHLVFATGLGDATPNMPVIPGMDKFKGRIMHSAQYKNYQGFEGQKVVVIGAGNSVYGGHDVASDLAKANIDVTIFQRSSNFVMNLDKQWKHMGGALYSENSPPTPIADLLHHSVPHLVQENGLAQRAVKKIVEGDKELIEKLEAVGFKTNLGIKDTGVLILLKTKAGGHYFETGASQMIIDGQIKLKNDSQVACFTETGLKFENGSQLEADTVVCATGVGDTRNSIRSVCGDEVADTCNPIWGLDQEGEIQGVWRDLGVPGLWYMMGPLQMARFFSKLMALQIKATEEGIFGTRYSIKAESA
ncbi:FAD/NAD-binding domain-containing protein [Laetiporus sulphureus 93-53]|uniref:FAD/NAD-binding domain-containing protein n=1 Tax=Laetiporus sulphureus 93-53 TaxID=1314785 RepID=A0A165FQD4_9APHY|nr:FAD/NAD-binding domain-containing protein [Laetiporus sulphureus 93-53]KZT09319.1 FAD/NAD-binding domain-containing protein [Laetiporus sulphureus 93-53]